MKARRFLTGLGIAASLATTGTLLPAATAPAEAAGYNWGAIAWNYQGRTAYAVDYPSQAAARNKAKRLCGANCGYFTFYNSCGAVAYKFTSSRTRVGTARGYATAAAAKSAARKKAGPGSRVRAWACTTR
ncbi:hypothetical protein GOHSU_16_01550 [Gordonia hirsuta DSM 44140 = NBRC 16056]|uniref:DUF4189 domain-containing protein n=1 Tax=Gordonia hirsuta DSM 44140 = NBRC 16056 TaxID=1121927 RepID=L7LAV6_9ACTN|nr:DUF4189 domain-containing protein [Gordonia hirsuta]GAC57197.1 hypothetical protein GOHSU_16_01550 [Gordonia hirsuta DSM 44140 = NBRC 16056]